MINFIQENLTGILVIVIVVIGVGSLVVASIQERRREKMPVEKPSETRGPQPGDRRWSRAFGSYVEMVHYRSDRDYHFKVLSGMHAGRTYKNQAPWSKLERWNPDPVYTPRSKRTNYE
jgi:hypothetical protein